jgi:hypothetical protein
MNQRDNQISVEKDFEQSCQKIACITQVFLGSWLEVHSWWQPYHKLWYGCVSHISLLVRPSNVDPGFSFLAAKYRGRTCGWWLVANTPTRGFPSVFCSQKREPWLNLLKDQSSHMRWRVCEQNLYSAAPYQMTKFNPYLRTIKHVAEMSPSMKTHKLTLQGFQNGSLIEEILK